MAFDTVSYMMGQKAAGGGGSSTLSGLTDVDISNPTNGQTLVYNATSGKWENGAGGGGGSGGGVLVVNEVDGSLDKTWQEIHDADIAILKIDSQIGYLYVVYSDSLRSEYSVAFFTVTSGGTSFDDPLIFETSTPNGYPQWAD